MRAEVHGAPRQRPPDLRVGDGGVRGHVDLVGVQEGLGVPSPEGGLQRGPDASPIGEPDLTAGSVPQDDVEFDLQAGFETRQPLDELAQALHLFLRTGDQPRERTLDHAGPRAARARLLL